MRKGEEGLLSPNERLRKMDGEWFSNKSCKGEGLKALTVGCSCEESRRLSVKLTEELSAESGLLLLPSQSSVAEEAPCGGHAREVESRLFEMSEESDC